VCYAGTARKCPHCNTGIHSNPSNATLKKEEDLQLPDGEVSREGVWMETYQRCPECGNAIIWIQRSSAYVSGRIPSFLVYPKGTVRPIPQEVTDPYRQDFIEACLVLHDSPKASAALSRRSLQAILRDKAGTKNKDLFDQIDEVTHTVPSHIAGDLHALRNIGNFAAHPLKSTHTGEIMDVEPNEAEWNLDVIELLFDFYFVQPAISARRKADLNKRLQEAGKPQIP
jgi:hypothetical protein